jgi:hypothetical protein
VDNTPKDRIFLARLNKSLPLDRGQNASPPKTAASQKRPSSELRKSSITAEKIAAYMKDSRRD